MLYSFLIIISFLIGTPDDEKANASNLSSDLMSLEFKSLENEKVILQGINKELICFFVLSPECPLCQNYTLTIKEIMSQYVNVEFIAIFPGETYSKREIKKYLNKYELSLTSIMDKDYRLCKTFEANVTPETYLYNSKGEILYEGAIDNWIPELGKKRKQITQHYLKIAINSFEDGEAVNTPKTEAIGCKIQY